MNKNYTIKIFTVLTILLILIPTIAIATQNPEEHIHSCFSTTNKTWYVNADGSADFTRIQDALDAASDGDTIFVYNGFYEEHVEINKQIKLQGENNEQTIINSDYQFGTIRVLADNIEISNFTIISEGSRGRSIHFPSGEYDNSNSKIVSNIIRSGNIGIQLSSTNSDITSNHIIRTNILVFGGRNNKISYNYFDAGRIALSSASDNVISYNIIESSSTGITTYSACVGNTITYNVIQDCDVGIRLDLGDKNTISHNDFKSNKYLNAFIWSTGSTWRHNYWGRPRLLPKPIFGYVPLGNIFFLDFDMRPAIKPNLG